MNSKKKGSRGELEASKELKRVLGCEARRGQQFSGSPDSPDIVCDIPVHFEVKRTETFNAYKAMEQAEGDCGENPPVVLHRKNNKPWLVVVKLDDLPRLAVAVYLQLQAKHS